MGPPSSSTLPLSPSSTSSQPQTPTATSSFTRLLDPPCLNFIAPRIDPLLPPDLSAIDLRSLKFKNHLVEASFRLSQACLSVTRARTISLALALTNLLYSLADLLRLEPYSKVFWFTLCSRTVGSTLLIMIVYLLLHCVSNELSVRINDCASTFDLFTDPETIKQDEQNKGQRNRGVSFDESLSLENGTFHAPRTRCTRKLSNLRHFAAIISGTLKRPLLGSEQNSSYAGSSRSSGLNETRVQVDNPSPIPYTESQLNEPPPKTKIPQSCFSILLPQLVTSQNYPFFVVPSTIILSLVGSLSLYLYPDNGSQYLICLSLVIYWTIHHASFTIPWQFAVCASVIVSIPVTTVVLQLPVIYRQEPQKTVCVLAVVYVALVYANYFHELQSRQMFWLLEKAKADKSTVEKAVVMNSTNEAKSEFIANVSHEMRTPLSAVICASSLLMDGNLSSDEVLHLAKIVHATSETLSVLINDVLDFASCEANRLSLRPSPISLADLANDTISCLAPGFALKRLDLACHVDTRLWYHKVICDGSRLNQILVNLLNNGMKFTSTGGVSLNMDVVSYDTINYPQTATVHICIEDSGMGIPADAISQLGGRFYQVESGAKKPTGTGLGLFISRALIENMGSHWEVTSNVGQGTKFEFTLTLPLASAGDSFENRVLSNTASDLEDVLKAFTPEDEPSRWYCLVIGGSVLGRRSFLNHLEDLKVAMVEDATPDEWKEDTPMNSVQSHASSPMPSSSAASKSLDYEHRVSSSDDSIKYRGLRFRIREFVRRVRNVDPYGIPILFADECFVPQNLGLDPLKKHGANGVAVLDRSFDLEKWGSDSEDPSSPLEGPRVRMQEDEEDHEIATFLFPVQVRHRLYNDKSAESFSRSSSRGMARPLFAEAATTMEYEDHVRDLGNQRRSSYCSTDTISSRSKRGSVSTDTFASPLFWAPLNKPITAGGIAKTMKTAFAARAMWQKPTTHPLSPVPSPDLVDGHEISSAAPLREGSRRPSGEQAGETLWTTPQNASAIAGADTRVSPNPRRSSLRGKTLSETTVPESVVPKRPRVLVAEDNAVIVALVTRILAIAGFKADFATDGEMALKMFEDSIDSHGSSYGAIMMDVRMDRMDGVTCAKRIRQLQKSRGIRHTPILGTTGQVLERDGEEFPFDEVLPKPYDRARLVNTLRGVRRKESIKLASVYIMCAFIFLF